MSMLLRLASDPGLVLCAVLVVAFAAVAWRRAYVAHRENQRWLAECRARRALNIRLACEADEAVDALEGVARRLRAIPRDTSSLLDDSPQHDSGRGAD